MNRIYLDNAATTAPHPEVIEIIHQALIDYSGNPSSIHDDGRKSKFLIEESREEIASLLGKEPAEIIFTSGATESINTALKSIFFYKLPSKVQFRSSRVEHHATLHSLDYLKTKGAELIFEKVNSTGEVVSISDKPVDLNSFMAVNNELGSVLDSGLVSALKQNNQKLHLDAVQALGKIDLTVYLKADFLSFTSS